MDCNGINDDGSFGRGKSYKINEQIILDFNDDYEHIDDAIEYIIENELMPPPSSSVQPSHHSDQETTPSKETSPYKTLEALYNSCYTVSCNCNSENSTDCCNVDCLHGGNYTTVLNYKNTLEMVLNKNRKIQDLIYECSAQCKCPTTFLNRLVQFGPRKHLQITKIPHMNNQLGVITGRPIVEGSFICEYAGEILTREEACIRESFNNVHNLMNYIICLNEYSTDVSHDQKNSEEEKSENDDPATSPSSRIQTFIDPSRRGNIGRYLNHSCEPNCEILSVRIDSPLPKLGIFAKRNIKAMEELCFEYKNFTRTSNSTNVNRKICLCNTKSCRKYLPNESFD